MNKSKQYLFGFGLLVLLLSISCQFLSGEEKQNAVPTEPAIVEEALPQTAPAEGESESETVVYNTDFPLPETVENFQQLGPGEDAINFQTDLNVDEAVAFYRNAFKEKGLSEDTLLASVEDTTFSIVFRGDPNGKAVVVQGVDLGGGALNINIRYEET